MKRRLIACLLLAILLLPLFTGVASADCGPKPSVKITFRGLEKERYFVTLLSQADSTGPWSWDPDRKADDQADETGDRQAWEAFLDYEDADGFYFLGYFEDCSESDLFQWNYYPPQTFKILLYFPEYDRLTVSDAVYSRYAFDSYFTADVTDFNIGQVSESADMRVSKSYDYDWELLTLLFRVALTVFIEVLLALIFGFRDKRSLKIILVTNLVTQNLLNLGLNLIRFKAGPWAEALLYFGFELGVFLIEGFLYAHLLPQKAGEEKHHPWAYAFAANFLSFLIGIFLSILIPNLF